MRRRSFVTRISGVLIPLAAALFVAQPASAHVTFTSGSPGVYKITDTDTSPGARCYYPDGIKYSNNDLSKIKIYAPKMYAKSGTQWVGWQYSIQHAKVAGDYMGAFVTYYKSPVLKAQAGVSSAAAFSAQTFIPSTNPNRWWRVKLLLFWYKTGSKTTISGQVNDVIDWYTWTYPPGPPINTINQYACIPGE